MRQAVLKNVDSIFYFDETIIPCLKSTNESTFTSLDAIREESAYFKSALDYFGNCSHMDRRAARKLFDATVNKGETIKIEFPVPVGTLNSFDIKTDKGFVDVFTNHLPPLLGTQDLKALPLVSKSFNAQFSAIYLKRLKQPALEFAKDLQKNT
jgi:hypothetical protein